uniref:Ig-like domain-containing protein n=1 Tax=Gasterosteus aculeatus aculeatus TaxID=481459 RepID=G3QCK4_GASAC
MKPSLVDFMMKILLLLALLTGSEGSSVVVGVLGGDVTLPCAYDSGRYGRLSVCWGRGSIPASGCGDQLVSTDGHEAAGPSGRHRLLGRLEDGDVSMTILNVSRADAGRYGCRVDIPGWFNDDKHHFDVDVEEAPQTTTSMTSTGETTTTNRDTTGTTQSTTGTTHTTDTTQSTTGTTHTTGHVTSTQRLPTSSSSGAELSGGPDRAKCLLRPESLQWRTSTRWRPTEASTSTAPDPPSSAPDPMTPGASLCSFYP